MSNSIHKHHPSPSSDTSKTLEDYKSRLSSDPYLRLIDFCKEQHTDYRQLIYWMSHHQLSVRRLQAEARGEILEKESETFIQFVSVPKPIGKNARVFTSIVKTSHLNLSFCILRTKKQEGNTFFQTKVLEL